MLLGIVRVFIRGMQNMKYTYNLSDNYHTNRLTAHKKAEQLQLPLIVLSMLLARHPVSKNECLRR